MDKQGRDFFFKTYNFQGKYLFSFLLSFHRDCSEKKEKESLLLLWWSFSSLSHTIFKNGNREKEEERQLKSATHFPSSLSVWLYISLSTSSSFPIRYSIYSSDDCIQRNVAKESTIKARRCNYIERSLFLRPVSSIHNMYRQLNGRSGTFKFHLFPNFPTSLCVSNIILLSFTFHNHHHFPALIFPVEFFKLTFQIIHSSLHISISFLWIPVI